MNEPGKFDGCPFDDFKKFTILMSEIACSEKWPFKNRCGRIDCKHWFHDKCNCQTVVNTDCTGCD